MPDLETLTLTQQRSKLLQIGLGALYSLLIVGCITVSISLLTINLWVGLLNCLLLLPLMAFCVYLLRMNRDPVLQLTPTGLSERTETDRRQFNWSDIETFGIYSFRAQSRQRTAVGFNFSESFRRTKAYKKVRLTAKTERALTGYDWHLSNFYGKTPEQLVALLNRYHQRYR